ncbi:peptidase inhibitor family I36 protein [Phytomonospora sp. NPDC050363]|uniref:peptidase inhibitor family I36 protein n=1 Tax=Phytomonospora sp. NPDC050363 TaxID=3155642 RepID=UPI0034046EE2
MSLGWKTRVGAVAAMGLLGLAAVATPAGADTVDQLDHPGCPDGYFCVWTGQNFTGDQYGGNQGGTCYWGIPGGWSMANQMGHAVHAYEFSDCTGQSFTLEPGYDTANAPFPIYSVAT